MKPTLFYFISFMVTSCVSKREISPSLSVVQGPAFNVDIVLPVRYFYIQAIDHNGKK